MSGGAKNYLDLIVRHEGFRAKPYCDKCGETIARWQSTWVCGCQGKGVEVGSMTIGCGLNLDISGLTQPEARYLAGVRAADLMGALSRFTWYSELDAVRRAAILDLAYNVGFDGLLRFREMIAALSHYDWCTAADCLRQSAAARQEPRRILELATMLATGAWPEGDF